MQLMRMLPRRQEKLDDLLFKECTVLIILKELAFVEVPIFILSMVDVTKLHGFLRRRAGSV